MNQILPQVVVAPVRFRLLVVLEFLSLVVLGLTLSLGLFFVDSSGDAFTVKRVGGGLGGGGGRGGGVAAFTCSLAAWARPHRVACCHSSHRCPRPRESMAGGS